MLEKALGPIASATLMRLASALGVVAVTSSFGVLSKHPQSVHLFPGVNGKDSRELYLNGL